MTTQVPYQLLSPDAQVALTAFRNKIINGDMRIDQRNAGASVTPLDGQYLVDRWAAFRSQVSKFSAQQNAGAVTPPPGFANYLGMTSLSAYASLAADYFGVNQSIEGFNVADLAWGTASAKAITMSFLVRSSLPGLHGGAIRNSGSTRSYVFSYTVASANTWELKTVTIPGDTSGTWLSNSGVGMQVWFDLGSGSSSTGAAGVWGSAAIVRPTGSVSMVGTNGATFRVTGVQIESGSVATPFEHRGYGSELAACQRYFEACVGGIITSANTVNGYIATSVTFAAAKRIAPVVARISDIDVSGVSTPYSEFVTAQGFRAVAQVTTSSTARFHTLYSASAEL